MGHYNYKIKKHTRKIIIYCEQKFIVVQTGATATVSTLATVVGQPNTPTKKDIDSVSLEVYFRTVQFKV